MALWLIRAGKNGEHENKFLEDKKVYLTWNGFSENLEIFSNREELKKKVVEIYSDSVNIPSSTGQIWRFGKEMKIGDWVVLPSKMARTIHFGKITGNYLNQY